jgi:hypothetical protein
MRILIGLTIAVSVFCSSAFAFDPLRPKPYIRSEAMSVEERFKFIALLEGNAEKYASSLNAVSWKSFSAVSGSPEIIASLTTEAEDTKALMKEFLAQLRVLKQSPNDAGAWLLLLRSYYLVAPYMDDLNDRGIVKADEYIGLRLLLPVVFDRILLPAYAKP